jgi:hypothetical protein
MSLQISENSQEMTILPEPTILREFVNTALSYCCAQTNELAMHAVGRYPTQGLWNLSKLMTTLRAYAEIGSTDIQNFLAAYDEKFETHPSVGDRNDAGKIASVVYDLRHHPAVRPHSGPAKVPPQRDMGVSEFMRGELGYPAL